MTRYHATSNGNIAFTATEELEADRETAEWAAGADDRAAVEARTKRNDLIQETDFHALTDVEMTAEITAYRQELRDITAQEDFPANIVWPTVKTIKVEDSTIEDSTIEDSTIEELDLI